MEWLLQPWPWYVAGPLIGLIVPVLLLLGGKTFGVSANLRHMCAATMPAGLEFLRYDWKTSGLWNLTFIVGVALGGFLAVTLLSPPDLTVATSEATVSDLQALGLTDFTGLVPTELISFSALGSTAGFMAVVVGGILVGFGARYAGGCTSGHAISGLAALEGASLMAVVGFFIGGLLVTHVLLPFLI